MIVAAPAHVLLTTPLLARAERALDAAFEVHRLWTADDPAAFLQTHASRIRGVATTHGFGPIDGLLDALPAAEIVASFGVGYDHIDAADATRRGVVVTNTPDVLTDEVADLAVGLTLATLRRIPQADRHVRSGAWRRGPFPLSATLRGRSVGLLGLGRIGQAIARRFAGFGVAVAYHARHPVEGAALPYYSTPVELAAASDILVVVVPGGAATRRLVDARVLAALGPDGVLVNVARGSVVDEAALIAALESGAILAAGLDVYEAEPDVPEQLVTMEQVVLLPHVGSATGHTRNAMAMLVVDNLKAWFANGAPLTPVPESRALLTGAVDRRPEPAR